MNRVMNAELSAESVAADLAAVRNTGPIVHNITNYVVMNVTANALLAVGASPVMAHAPEEVEEITAASSAVVLNIGTLSGRWVEAMLLSGRTAVRCGIPIVLDPVGTGFSSYRTNTVLRMLDGFIPSVIKGNPSEIHVLSRACGFIHSDAPRPVGVDSSSEVEGALESAVSLARGLGCTAVITGPVDYVTDGTRVTEIRNGAGIMARTTGMGCTASAVTGAFASVTGDAFRAAVSAMAVMGVAGEMAAADSRGNGSFQMNFLDELYTMGADVISACMRNDKI